MHWCFDNYSLQLQVLYSFLLNRTRCISFADYSKQLLHCVTTRHFVISHIIQFTHRDQKNYHCAFAKEKNTDNVHWGCQNFCVTDIFTSTLIKIIYLNAMGTDAENWYIVLFYHMLWLFCHWITQIFNSRKNNCIILFYYLKYFGDFLWPM